MKAKTIVAASSMVLLAACAGDKGPPRACPQIAIVRSLQKIEDHGNDAAEESRMVGGALMQKVDGTCEYDSKGANIKFALSLAAERGPALGGNKISFPYFVSLVGPDDKVIGKELMTAEFTFDGDHKIAQLEQSLKVRIPLADKETAEPYRVLIGFQLTESQIKAQREKEQGSH